MSASVSWWKKRHLYAKGAYLIPVLSEVFLDSSRDTAWCCAPLNRKENWSEVR